MNDLWRERVGTCVVDGSVAAAKRGRRKERGGEEGEWGKGRRVEEKGELGRRGRARSARDGVEGKHERKDGWLDTEANERSLKKLGEMSVISRLVIHHFIF